ncbi:MAG: hypothetical protein EOP52_01620 [Sphingobacteriales bacterium]|nr:MAG: hypothetical protein EOP52_01620 [Sphingobacteriales bacterium]
MHFRNCVFFLLILLSGFRNVLWAQSETDTTRILSGGSLKEVKVRTPREKWAADSARSRLLFRKPLSDAVFKPELKNPLQYGLRLDGGVTWLALKLSGKQKKYRKFKQEIEAHEQEQLFAIRYNAPLVTRLTGLQDSAAYVFIRQNPMSRDFFETATELELMQWVRDRYRAWHSGLPDSDSHR